MKRRALIHALGEAARFLEIGKAILELDDNRGAALLHRVSMDLTRALVEMRKR